MKRIFLEIVIKAISMAITALLWMLFFYAAAISVYALSNLIEGNQ